MIRHESMRRCLRPKMLRVTLDAVGKIDGVDASRPVLLGYSAGGQMALHLWQQDPDAWGGLVLDAAYPVRRTASGYTVTAPPEGDVKTPIFALVGTADGGARAWKDAGVPLVVHFIEGKGHAWLLGPEQEGLLAEWLEGLATPGEPEPGTGMSR